jgi:hypothetical protein
MKLNLCLIVSFFRCFPPLINHQKQSIVLQPSLSSMIPTKHPSFRYIYAGFVVALFGLLLLLSEIPPYYSGAGTGSRQLSGPNNNSNNKKHHNQNKNTSNNKNKHHSLLPKNDPRTVQLKTHHTLDADFKERVNVLRSELTDSEWAAINAFSKTLRESHCRRDDNSFSSLNTYVHSKFTLDERLKWMNPTPGVIRSINQESTVPCETAQYWVDGGFWQSVPMWSHCCNQGAAIAKCPTPIQETPSTCSKPEALSGNSKCHTDGTLICYEYVHRDPHLNNSDCLVYTFGIANQWDFEDWIGSMGCEVHAHDPTTRYKEIHEGHQAKNVHFHYQGLGIPGDTATHFRGYGDMGGSMMTLGELWRDHGHGGEKNRPISILKIDCEGCEFEAFHQLAVNEPEVISQVCTIIMEVHFSESLQMESAHNLKRMASFWQKYIEEFGFRFWYLHENPGATFDQRVNPLLLDIGMDPTICCYEIALRRPDCDSKIAA